MNSYKIVTSPDSIQSTVKKINDYLITFVGDIQTELSDNKLTIKYLNTSFISEIEIKDSQILLKTKSDDTITLSLLKNIASNSGFRIYNTKGYFLVNDNKLLDISSSGIKRNIFTILKRNNLKPLFEYRDGLTYFAQDKLGAIYLINRHFLEYIINQNPKKYSKTEFCVKVTDTIAEFVALFDRGLISLNFQKHLNNDTKITNLSGFDIYHLDKDIKIKVTDFTLDVPKQSFIQQKTETMDTKEVKKLIESGSYLHIKVSQDYTYQMIDDKLFKIINLFLYLK